MPIISEDNRVFWASDGTEDFEFEWTFDCSKPKANVNGTTGWAEMRCRSGGGAFCETVPRRIHLCAFQPCRAVHAKSKYGLLGPPRHLRPYDWRPTLETAVADDEATTMETGLKDTKECDVAIVEETAVAGAKIEATGPAVAEHMDSYGVVAIVAETALLTETKTTEETAIVEGVGHQESVAAEGCSDEARGIVFEESGNRSDTEGEHREDREMGEDLLEEWEGLLDFPTALDSEVPETVSDSVPVAAVAVPELAAVVPPEAAVAVPESDVAVPEAAVAVPEAAPAVSTKMPEAAVAVSEPMAAPLKQRVPAPALVSDLTLVDRAPQLRPSLVSGCAVLERLLNLVRQIQTPRAYVGYSAFVCFALLNKRRVCMWEGKCRVDLLETYAPWAKDTAMECAVDGVCVAMKPAVAGPPEMCPITEELSAHSISHFVAGIRMDFDTFGPSHSCGGASGPSHICGTALEAFYTELGVLVVGTVADGDCGIDTMCQMVGTPQSREERYKHRQEIADFLLLRLREPWLHEMMVCLQEVESDDVEEFRKMGGYQDCDREDMTPAVAVKTVPIAVAEEGAPTTIETPAVAEEPQPAVAEDPQRIVTPLTLKALAWATKVQDQETLGSIASELPIAVLEEQVRAYQTSAVAKTPQSRTIEVRPHLLSSRRVVVSAFRTYLTQLGWQPGKRVPWGGNKNIVAAVAVAHSL